jgi:hypothetical protein
MAMVQDRKMKSEKRLAELKASVGPALLHRFRPVPLAFSSPPFRVATATRWCSKR